MKKRMLAVLTTLAMLISMCSVSVYAEDTIDLTEYTEPVTYTYNVVNEVSGTGKVELIHGAFGASSSHIATKFTGVNVGAKGINSKDLVYDGNENTDEKKVTEGQTIVVSYKVASEDWWTSATKVKFIGGISGKFRDNTKASKTRFSVEHCKGIFTKANSTTGDFTNDGVPSDLVQVEKAPNRKWVKYDLVIKVDENDNKVSFYADGRPFFENKSIGLGPYEYVTAPAMKITVDKDCILYVSDVSMTIYPAGYEGNVVEKNPLKTGALSTDDFKGDFKREDDGSILYKGLRLLSNADEDLIADENWEAQYVGADGYMRIKKGDTVYYYEKASETISNFTINNMDVNVGKKDWKVKVRNIEENSISPVVLLASFIDDEMVKCAYSDPNITIEPDETKEIDVSLDVSEGENVNTIKIFIFDSFETLTPLKMERQTSKK